MTLRTSLIAASASRYSLSARTFAYPHCAMSSSHTTFGENIRRTFQRAQPDPAEAYDGTFAMSDRFHWARLLAFITGLVNQELLLRNEYLVAENRILRAHLPSRLRLSDVERSTLARSRSDLAAKP
jgi:hypothetical protein